MGRQVKEFLLWKETTQNTIPSNPQCFSYHVESTDVKADQRNEAVQLLGNGRGASEKSFGLYDIAGSQAFVLTTDNAPILLSLAIGEATSSANATSDAWTAATAYVKGDIVNHSDGLHTLVCYVAGTSHTSSEPDLSAYTTAAAGRDVKIVDEGVTWIIMPLLKEQSGERADCLTSFGIEVKDDNDCSTSDPEYCRYTGMFINSLPLSLSGEANAIKSTAALVGMEEEDSILVADNGGTYEAISAKTGFAKTELAKDNWSLKELTYYLNGSQSAEMTTSFDLTVNNNVSFVDPIEQNGKIASFGAIDVSGSTSLLMDKTLYAEAAGHTVKSSKLQFKKDNGCLMEIELPQFIMEKTYKAHETAKNAMITIPWAAFDSEALKSIKWKTISPVEF